jgi:hypothetical protein
MSDQPNQPPPTFIEPAFEYADNDYSDKFNLRPRATYPGAIPEDQRQIVSDVYEARNVLKLLKDKGAIADELFKEFIARINQAGLAGCAADKSVHPALAAGALEQIRADVVRRAGMPLVFRYLSALAGWALPGLILGAVIALLDWKFCPDIRGGYGFVLIGAMIGAWFSVASSRWQIAFDTIPNYPDTTVEPAIRMLFVAAVALAFALFLHLSIITIKIGTIDLATFMDRRSVALLLGFIAGIGQRILSVQLTERAEKVLNPGG